MSKLICENLTKNYGKKTVLENLNLTLESGKIYGLIGRNGALGQGVGECSATDACNRED